MSCLRTTEVGACPDLGEGQVSPLAVQAFKDADRQLKRGEGPVADKWREGLLRGAMRHASESGVIE